MANYRRRWPAFRTVVRGQAGLLDIALDRDFAQNKTIYFCFTHDGGGNAAVARAYARTATPRSPTSRSSSATGPRRLQQSSAAASRRLPTATCSSRSAIISARAMKRKISASINGKIVRIGPDGEIPPGQPVRRQAGRAARNLELWPPQSAGPHLRSRTANCGSRSMARRAATRSTSSRRARTTAGR